MDRFEASWEHDADRRAAPGPGLDPEPGPERCSGRHGADLTGAGGWSESVWVPPGGEVLDVGTLLFADPFAETELRREMRLSELWGRCTDGCCTVAEFFELSTLITEVEALPDAACEDCAALKRPNAREHRALAATGLCRGHLRFHLGHARLDGEGAAPGPEG